MKIFIALLGSYFYLASFSQVVEAEFHHSNFFNATSRNILLEDNGLATLQHEAHHQLGIVGGQPASPGQFCYTTYLQMSDGYSAWSCTGSLISPSVVLTAGHCIEGASSAAVVVGATDLSQSKEPGRRVIWVSRSGLKVYDKYDTTLAYNDLAVIILRRPVTLNQYVCTVSLPDCSEAGGATPDGGSYTVIGWGKTSDSTQTSRLMYVNVPGESWNSCGDYYKRNAYYTLARTQMCSSGQGKKGTCNGDSGGPLVETDSTGQPVQRGIVSLGMRSCEMSAPSVYTDTTAFLSWICSVLNENPS